MLTFRSSAAAPVTDIPLSPADLPVRLKLSWDLAGAEILKPEPGHQIVLAQAYLPGPRAKGAVAREWQIFEIQRVPSGEYRVHRTGKGPARAKKEKLGPFDLPPNTTSVELELTAAKVLKVGGVELSLDPEDPKWSGQPFVLRIGNVTEGDVLTPLGWTFSYEVIPAGGSVVTPTTPTPTGPVLPAQRSYVVAKGATLDLLKADVEAKQADGWRLSDGFAYGEDGGGWVWAQPMARP